jgi:hydrogenase maturation protein HypF
MSAAPGRPKQARTAAEAEGAPVTALAAERMRVRGTVQGVGFRPTVWRIAQELGICGTVANDAQGVLITAVATPIHLDTLARRLQAEAPPRARISAFERHALGLPIPLPTAFVIGHSPVPADPASGTANEPGEGAAVGADTATCAACVAEIFDPFARRYRYPLTNCTHCGPRLSFVTGIPYDRARTTMAGYPMCADCQAEYDDPADRRFHAQPIACHVCGPRPTLRRMDGRMFSLDSFTFLDACDAAGSLLARGEVVAIQGLGGYQLACDATRPEAVARLRELKRREAKPFALMAASVQAVRAWCEVSDAEEEALCSAAAPIVLLRQRSDGQGAPLAPQIAPGLDTLGFMLPSTGVHHLVLRRMQRPIVMTSANLSEEPQATTAEALAARFPQGIDYALEYPRAIARRVDDSVLRVIDGAPRLLRRARGYAPEPVVLPQGFAAAPPVLAYGGAQKATLCLLHHGQAVLSQHLGDLADAATWADYRRALRDLLHHHRFTPQVHACDAHPDYLSAKLARAESPDAVPVLHHHAHIAACLVDNGWPLGAGPVLGVALDGLGYGEGGALWGGEFAIADYTRFERRGCFKPVALPGGEQAMREPWRNTYAHLMAELGWAAFTMNFAQLELHTFLAAKPRALLDGMLAQGVNAPLASSCGRLFDAVAAAMGLSRDRAAYEGQGAMRMEALVDHAALGRDDDASAYPFAIPRLQGKGLPYIEPLAMWNALLGDLLLQTPVPTMAARFHLGLARVICRMVDRLAEPAGAAPFDTPLRHVALSGGVFQNRVLHELVATQLRASGYTVLAHRRVPCNDGGLALGQAAIAAARAMTPRSTSPCA